MPVSVNVQTVHPRKLAAVRRDVALGGVGSAWRPALDEVWEFIRSQPGLRTDGHNIFLYHHPTQPGAPILCDFGVEVTRGIEELMLTLADSYTILIVTHNMGQARRVSQECAFMLMGEVVEHDRTE